MDSRRITVNGQLFNGPIVDGVEWEVTDVTGFGEPATVFASEQLVAQDGAWATTAYAGPRAVGLQGVVRAVDEIRAELAVDRLRALIGRHDWPLTLHYLSGDRTVWVRRDGDLTVDSRELPTEFTWQAVLKALDPAIYAGDGAGSGDLVLISGLPMTTGGLTFPVTFPVTFSGASGTGDLSVDLVASGRMRLRIDGPCTNPQIVVENSEGLFRLAWYGPLETGMWLDIDPQKRSALLQGQVSRTPSIRRWPRLAPGHNTIRFRAVGYHPDAQLTATIRPTL